MPNAPVDTPRTFDTMNIGQFPVHVRLPDLMYNPDYCRIHRKDFCKNCNEDSKSNFEKILERMKTSFLNIFRMLFGKQ